MQKDSTAAYERFAADLEHSGAAYHDGFSIRLVPWGPDDLPAYERVIHGEREIIVGTRGELFRSYDHARSVAMCVFQDHFRMESAS